ncbi:hypothetical protein BOX15_Mlig022924g2 [Macrostomum lignano]|uniref:TPR_REGION domain-containing protein n=1 Tax=Macrostomum lignano TaxID=282301 RepID=A0A267GZ79_9PLAT|nr:hypothetical protein BOX15_Mlig022924g2 [Macrostomum lignano]
MKIGRLQNSSASCVHIYIQLYYRYTSSGSSNLTKSCNYTELEHHRATTTTDEISVVFSWWLAVLLSSLMLWLLYQVKKIATGETAENLVAKGIKHKADKTWREAGRAFENAAEQFSKQRRCELDAANNYSEAANCYRKLPDTRPKAVRCLQQAAEMYAEQGQFSIAARQLEEAGDLLAASQQVEEAIDVYVRAADFWSGEDSPASAAGSRAKAAELTADCGRLAEAAAVFEDLGVSAEQHSLLSFGAKDQLAKSCLCLLCSGAAGVGEKAEQLAGLCGSFKDTDELSLVRSLVSATDARNVAAVDAAVAEFERFNNLDDFARRRLDQLRQFVATGGVQLQ